MLSNPMLDVAIGLVFLYLLLSIIVTVLQEFVASTLGLRNRNLLRAVEQLVGAGSKKDFFTHPLIFPLFRGEVDAQGDPAVRGPAYIPKRNFALAVLDLQSRRDAERRRTEPAGAGAERGQAGPGILERAPAFALAAFFEDSESGVGLTTRINKFGATAAELIDKIANEDIQKAAKGALTAAVGELKTATDVVDTAIRELENLFDSTMDRAAGWYKVHAQRIAFAIGCLVAVVLNADTIYVARQLAADDKLRDSAVAAASAYYAAQEGSEGGLTAICAGAAAPATAAGASEAAAPATPADAAAHWRSVTDCVAREIDQATSQLAEIGYPIGWTGGSGGWWPGQPGQNPLWAIVGFAITGLALSLGSSFWFDLLGKFMNVRMTGKRPPADIDARATTS